MMSLIEYIVAWQLCFIAIVSLGHDQSMVCNDNFGIFGRACVLFNKAFIVVGTGCVQAFTTMIA